MDVSSAIKSIRQGQSPVFPPEAKNHQFAEELDAQDALRHLREQFILPTSRSLNKKSLSGM
jgi:kynureninase